MVRGWPDGASTRKDGGAGGDKRLIGLPDKTAGWELGSFYYIVQILNLFRKHLGYFRYFIFVGSIFMYF